MLFKTFMYWLLCVFFALVCISMPLICAYATQHAPAWAAENNVIMRKVYVQEKQSEDWVDVSFRQSGVIVTTSLLAAVASLGLSICFGVFAVQSEKNRDRR